MVKSFVMLFTVLIIYCIFLMVEIMRGRSRIGRGGSFG